MSISNFIKDCTKNIAGNQESLFVAPYPKVVGITLTDDEVSAIEMSPAVVDPVVPIGTFAYLESDLDSIQYTSDGTAARGYFSEQNLIAKFSKKSKALEKTVSELTDSATCGLVAIRVDGNGKAWISGIAPATAAGNRPYMSVQDQFDSGEGIEDSEDGNRYTITMSRMSATKEYPFNAALTEDILDGSAVFINWPD